MAVLIPHKYNGEDFQVTLQYFAKEATTKRDWTKVTVIYNAPQRPFQYEFLAAPPFTKEPEFLNYACYEAKKKYDNRGGDAPIHSKFDENNNGK